MNFIDKNEMDALVANSGAVVIDVREPAEFLEASLPGAINHPSSAFNIEDYKPFIHRPLILMCHTNNRATKIAGLLQDNDFTRLHILKNGMSGILQSGAVQPSNAKGWTIDRQFRFTLGMLLAIFFAGYFLVSEKFIIIPAILCAGLVFTSLIDKCYMRQGIAMLPWNKGKKV